MIRLLCIPCVIYILSQNFIFRKHACRWTLTQKISGKRCRSKYFSWSQNGYDVLNGYNIFFNLSDHLTPIIKQELKESTVAYIFSCSRIAAIVNCLGDHNVDSIVKEMQE